MARKRWENCIFRFERKRFEGQFNAISVSGLQAHHALHHAYVFLKLLHAPMQRRMFLKALFFIDQKREGRQTPDGTHIATDFDNKCCENWKIHGLRRVYSDIEHIIGCASRGEHCRIDSLNKLCVMNLICARRLEHEGAWDIRVNVISLGAQFVSSMR